MEEDRKYTFEIWEPGEGGENKLVGTEELTMTEAKLKAYSDGYIVKLKRE